MPKIRIIESREFEIELKNYRNIDENGKDLTDLKEIFDFEFQLYDDGDLEFNDLELNWYDVDLLDDEGKVMKTVEWRKDSNE